MLTTLRIKNLALVSDLTLELEPGYNAITGETGAGKSVIIGALTLVLGERADRNLIRSGTDNCTVEAVFDTARLKVPLAHFLDENGLEPSEDHQLVVKRTFTAGGANRQFINGSATSLSTLAQLGEWLVDMHGPHEHQSLLHPAQQLDLLDEFGKLSGFRQELGLLADKLTDLAERKRELVVDERTYAQQLDLLRFQVDEITRARLQPSEDQVVGAEYHRASNAARLLQLSQAALDILSESETSLTTQSGVLGRTLQELRKLDPAAGPLLELHEQTTSILRELQAGLSHYSDKLEIDPTRLQELEARMDLLQSLKKKYGPTLDDVISFGTSAREKLQSLEQRDEELARLDAAIGAARQGWEAAAKILSAKRRQVIPQLAKSVNRHLTDLGFKQSRFDVALSLPATDPNARVSRNGTDSVEFQFAPNPGEPPRPLRAIASSGELARVMLAIKTVLAADDKVPVLVFDEVDANVGGETANVVGEKMQQIAAQRQVLCITHLPQVAAPASAHYVVTKTVKDGRTISEITRLDAKERVTEIARMLGGQGDAARKHAAALLKSQ